MFHRFVVSLLLAAGAASVGAQQPVGAEDSVEKARALIALLEKGEFAKADATLTAAMKKEMPLGGMKTVWDDITGPMGALKACRDPDTQMQGALRAVTFACEFGSTPASLRLVYNDKGELAGFFIGPARKK